MHVYKAVYLFARAAMTKYHILDGLKEIYFPTILEAGNLTSRFWQVDFF